MTKVIHIRDSKGGPDEVYIGRRGKKAPNAIFGNPVAVDKPCVVCDEVHSRKGTTLPCYERYLRSRLEYDEEFSEKFWRLRDKTLVCFCCPKTGWAPGAEICHGQVMARILDQATN